MSKNDAHDANPGCILTSKFFIRELNIFMDVDFVLAWMNSSAFAALANILSRTPGLQSLRILVAENNGPRSAWRKFGSAQAVGIPFGAAFEEACGTTVPFHLPMLTNLELDGFENIASLLRIAPNLISLSTRLSTGFSQKSNVELTDALKFVSGLKSLAYTPESLRMYSAPTSREEDEYPQHGAVDPDTLPLDIHESSLEFVMVVAKALPQLEVLDLTSRSFGSDVTFCSASEPIRPEVRDFCPCTPFASLLTTSLSFRT